MLAWNNIFNRRLAIVGVLTVLWLVLPLTGCGHNKILAVDRTSGYFADPHRQARLPDTTAVTLNRKFDIDSNRALIVVADSVNAFVIPSKSDYTRKMIAELRYFDEVISVSELRERLRKSGQTTPGLRQAYAGSSEFVIIQAMAEAYQPFLWLRWAHRRHNKEGGGEAYQLILTDAITLEDYFIAETPYHYTSTGPQDAPRRMTQYRKNQYPMLNALIDYIKEHSGFYLHQAKTATDAVSGEPAAPFPGLEQADPDQDPTQPAHSPTPPASRPQILGGPESLTPTQAEEPLVQPGESPTQAREPE
ncbi:MAG: hypothetical protein K0U66_11175 [Gammaproteobacteria bacterium]|nr:hypothetical protein [Gammaproteobacteria bacterium]